VVGSSGCRDDGKRGAKVPGGVRGEGEQREDERDDFRPGSTTRLTVREVLSAFSTALTTLTTLTTTATAETDKYYAQADPTPSPPFPPSLPQLLRPFSSSAPTRLTIQPSASSRDADLEGRG
jgi:hypothetical protein